MSTVLPEYHFRVRENGAVGFRINTENRQRRIKMDQFAIINIRNGEVKPHGQRTLSDTDKAGIEHWVKERKAHLARRDMNDIIVRSTT